MLNINDSNLDPVENYGENNIKLDKIQTNVKQEQEVDIISSKKNNNVNEISIPIEENFEQFQNKKNNVSSIKNCINYFDNLDKELSSPLHNYSPSFKIECIFYCFARLFNIQTVIIYLISIVIYSFLKLKNIYLSLIPITHVICGGLFTIILKLIIRRPRPILKTKRYFKLKESTHSMPSGDSLQAGIFATMIILYTNNFFKFFGILLIPAAMLGRVFYNLHYWFDCIIGAIMGIFISIGTYTIINKYFLNI